MDKAELITKEQIREDIPLIKPGMKIKVFEKIREGEKQRIAQFSGIVIAVKHGTKTINGTFTVRAVLDGIGVEKTWPIHSPSIEKIEVLDVLRVRRSKLYYIRNLSPKKLRKKLRPLKEFAVLKKRSKNEVQGQDIIQETEKNDKNIEPKSEVKESNNKEGKIKKTTEDKEKNHKNANLQDKADK